MLLKNFLSSPAPFKEAISLIWVGLFVFVYVRVCLCLWERLCLRRIVFETDCVGEKVDSEILCYLKLQVAGTVRQILNLSWLAFSQQFFLPIQICITSSINRIHLESCKQLQLPWNCLGLGEIERQFPKLSCSAWKDGTIYVPNICKFWYTTALFRPSKSTPRSV